MLRADDSFDPDDDNGLNDQNQGTWNDNQEPRAPSVLPTTKTKDSAARVESTTMVQVTSSADGEEDYDECDGEQPPEEEKDEQDEFLDGELSQDEDQVVGETQDHSPLHAPGLSLVPPCCRRRRGRNHRRTAPSESTGLSLDFYARGHILMSSLFLGPALLELAQAAAGSRCMDSTDPDEDALNNDEMSSHCKIYGFRPTSLLTNIAIASGLLGSLSMPFVGAVVDHTPYRRQVGAISGIVLAALKGLEVIVGHHTWFFVAVLQVVTGILYNVHATTAYAYTSELTNDPNQQAKYNSSFNVVLYVSMLVFLFLIYLLSMVLDDSDDVGTARLSQILTSSTSMICFVVAWKYYFRNRPAMRTVPAGQSLWSCGFAKVWDTSRRIVRHHRALSWAILAMMFGEAAVSGFATIATTYLKVVLEMSSGEIGLVFLLVFVMGIPGSYLGAFTTVRLQSPVKSAIICDVGCIIVTTFASMVLTGPQHKGLPTLIFSAVWGIGLGWLPPVDTTLFMNLMPTDSRVELMGMMMLAAVALSWLPPLVFSLLNESGVSMAWGLVSLNLYFVLSIVCLAQIGNYQDARMEATFTLATSTTSPHETRRTTSDAPPVIAWMRQEDDENNTDNDGRLTTIEINNTNNNNAANAELTSRIHGRLYLRGILL